MTIEIATQSPSVMSVNFAEDSSAQTSAIAADGGGASAVKSFMAALADAEEAVPAVDSGGEGVGGAGPELVSEKPLEIFAAVVPDPAFLLAQASVLAVPQAAAPIDRELGKAGSHQGRDGALPLLTALDSVPGGPKLTGQVKSGKAALDAAAQAAPSEVTGVADVNVSGVAAAAVGRDGAPDRMRSFFQELTVSLTKAHEVSTLALGAGRERTQETQTNTKQSLSELSAQNWAAPQSAGGAMGMEGVVATAASASADGSYAEQVSYWIGQDVQKAEMTLDGLGANPVEVSISMQGKEATVVFRSDEALTRDALTNASAQLQEAMSRQGVVLSGVSVGTSNSGDAQRREPERKSSEWKVSTVELVDESAVSTSRAGPSGRAIDLFV